MAEFRRKMATPPAWGECAMVLRRVAPRMSYRRACCQEFDRSNVSEDHILML